MTCSITHKTETLFYLKFWKCASFPQKCKFVFFIYTKLIENNSEVVLSILNIVNIGNFTKYKFNDVQRQTFETM